MRRWIPVLVILMLVPMLMGSSCNQIVRDEVAYKAELELTSQMALQSAASLKKLIALVCVCENNKFTTKDCEKAADTALVIEARMPWHKAMSLYNAGITKERPPKDPPVIPAIETLCPAPAPPAAPPAAPAPEPAPEAVPATEAPATDGGE